MAEPSTALDAVSANRPRPHRLEDWPGRERREPPRSDRHYLILNSLASVLRAELERTLGGRRDLRVLDIGCGGKPYYPFFAPYASEYRGVDAKPGALVDDLGTVEALPYDDRTFDVVVCTQVLEHVVDPARAVAEIARVLSPAGVAFVSTHGVFVYHPDPVDYWRWTHAGLEQLFRTTASWDEIRVSSNGEAVACLGSIACQYADELGRKLGSDRVRRGMVRLINTVAERVDRRFPPNARRGAPGSLSANYLVTARSTSG
jgi:SAM-dependent methyltransferase